MVVLEGLAMPLQLLFTGTSAIVLASMFWLKKHGDCLPFWQRLLLALGGCLVAWISSFSAGHAWAQNNATGRAAILGTGLPPSTAVVYLLTTPGPSPVAECFYLNRRILRINSPATDLPAAAEVVYVLAGRRPPVLETREWEACSEQVFSGGKRRLSWEWQKTALGLRQLRIVPESLSWESGSGGELRMYKGSLRPPL
jgi:hypothetical protein